MGMFIPLSKSDDSNSAYYKYILYIPIVSNYCPSSNFSQIHQCLSAQTSNDTEVRAASRRAQTIHGAYLKLLLLGNHLRHLS